MADLHRELFQERVYLLSRADITTYQFVIDSPIDSSDCFREAFLLSQVELHVRVDLVDLLPVGDREDHLVSLLGEQLVSLEVL